jgi:GNAT superfamily N-acetyltransferase/predicted nucleic acid-binding protein
MSEDNVKILSTGIQTIPYMDRVEALADSNKKALGFLPKSVYCEQADHGRLWIAISMDSDDCLGYLLFGGRYPTLRVFHLYVKPAQRKRGIGAKLLTQLLTYGEKHNYLTISARVAADLPANKFWDSFGFSIVRQEPGGRSAGRTINIRIRELNTPSLLGLLSCDLVTQKKGIQNLKIRPRPLVVNQTYVLDLNVFFDVVKKRLNHAEAARLISAGLNQEVRVFVTPEFTSELSRHGNANRPDPILEFARQLPTLPALAQATIDSMLPEMEAIVFPRGSSGEKHRSQIISDLVHLVYCSHHRATGFITRDKAILAASERLQEEYHLEILSPADLMKSAEDLHDASCHLYAQLGTESVSIAPATEHQRDEVEQFLVALGVGRDALSAIWHPGSSLSPRRRITARIADRLIAIAAWDNPSTLRRQNILHLYIDERLPHAETVIDHFLETVLRDSPPSSGRLLTLETAVEQVKTKSTASRRGFLSSLLDFGRPSGGQLTKYIFKGLIYKDNWGSFSRDFRDLTGLILPEKIPHFDEFDNTGISIRHHSGAPLYNLTLFEFEILVSPAVVACPGRGAVIVPIQAQFARDLLEYADTQMNLFPAQEALCHVEKAYFRSPRKSKLFKRGLLVLFYLSGSGGGSKEVIGCARVTYSENLSISEARGIVLLRQSVLSIALLEGIADSKGRVHAFTFDNYNTFPTRIPFNVLKTKKLISGANMVTVEPLSAKHAVQACEIGFSIRSDAHE